MEALFRALEAYQHLDPRGWAAVGFALPWWGGAALAILGLLFLLFGNGKLFRLVAGPLGALVGLLWAPLVAQRLGLVGEDRRVPVVAAIGLGGLSLGLPHAASFLGVGVPAGLLAGTLVGGGDWALGFIPGFLIAGALGVAAHRHLSALLSSVVGGWLLVLGVLAALRPVTPAADAVLRQPWGVLAAAGLFALAGAVYQLFVRLSPQERAVAKVDRARAKRKSKDQEALEKRWNNYSKDKGL